ncbi:hypothetical protein BCR35DRAFT_344682 [Leucosporidium creatinivorum]|uniref:C2H2-type domain-containing protein n=1 Tax=Leucosporidium creatinivorum TaxID=106004 RepID=A0A1Y2FZF4_9BASI|nr:hypothetical protein BCR35DRAFT_344682 [Leucosporidium creatinivorum]
MTTSPNVEDYNHPMSMSPQSPISPLELPPLPLPDLGDERYSPPQASLESRVSPSTLATNRSPPTAKPIQRRKRGSLPKEIDAKSGRPISPITGLPTKVIAKRGWPPKDIAKRVYTCPFEGCDRIFGRPSARETHIRSHNGVQPFICPISSCRRPFSVFSNLKRHMIVHPTVDFRSVTVNDLPHIHCIETEQGPMLEWDDAEEGEGEEFGPAAAAGSGGEGEVRDELAGMDEGEEVDWRAREGAREEGRRMTE